MPNLEVLDASDSFVCLSQTSGAASELGVTSDLNRIGAARSSSAHHTYRCIPDVVAGLDATAQQRRTAQLDGFSHLAKSRHSSSPLCRCFVCVAMC